MANRTVKDAKSVRGTNPQFLIEKIIRSRIYESKYWKEECFALSAELIVDKAMDLRYIGGVFGGNIKPTPFLCLTLKMLQIQPEKDIIVEFIKNEEFKYVRALGALYMRLVGSGVECYKYLEPLFNDGRKLRRQNRSGQYELIHMDEFIDELLREERSCDVILPRIQKRMVLEEANELEARISAALDDDIDEAVESSSESDEEDHPPRREERKRSPPRVKSTRTEKEKPRERDYDRSRRSDREREREKPREKVHRERSRSHERRHRSRTPVRSHRDKDHERDVRDRDRDRKSRKEYDERRDYDRREEERRDYDRRDYDHRNEDRRDYDRRDYDRRDYEREKYDQDKRRDRDRKTVY